MRGAGRAFCAGLDIKDRAGRDPGAVPFGGGFGFQGFLAGVYIKMRRCPQPIVALVHGAACGGGFAFALASDIRIAGESMRMNAAFIRLGLSACDMGVSYFLPRLVGVSVASELMLTGRFIHAPRALATGLVSEVVPDAALEGAAQTYIDEMLLASPMGLRMTKEGLNMAVDAASLEAAMAIENRNQLKTAASPNFAGGDASLRRAAAAQVPSRLKRRERGVLQRLDNEISGDDGNNIIDGGAGRDILTGYAGSDSFVFSSTLGTANADHIADFDPTADRIALDHSIFTGLATGHLNASAFVIGTAAQDAGDRVIYDPATGTLYFDPDGTGAMQAQVFATVHDGLALTADNIVVI
jgi:enoyl-CoA hydratase/carnithine racemase